MSKIILKGRAGQGIKLLGYILAKILTDNEFNVVLTFEYDAFIRSGESTAFLIYSKQKIYNPLIEKADEIYDLNNLKLKRNMLNKLNDKKIINMVQLGIILKKMKIKIDVKKIRKYLPSQNISKNIQAIKNGYQL